MEAEQSIEGGQSQVSCVFAAAELTPSPACLPANPPASLSSAHRSFVFQVAENPHSEYGVSENVEVPGNDDL